MVDQTQFNSTNDYSSLAADPFSQARELVRLGRSSEAVELLSSLSLTPYESEQITGDASLSAPISSAQADSNPLLNASADAYKIQRAQHFAPQVLNAAQHPDALASGLSRLSGDDASTFIQKLLQSGQGGDKLAAALLSLGFTPDKIKTLVAGFDIKERAKVGWVLDMNERIKARLQSAPKHSAAEVLRAKQEAQDKMDEDANLSAEAKKHTQELSKIQAEAKEISTRMLEAFDHGTPAERFQAYTDLAKAGQAAEMSRQQMVAEGVLSEPHKAAIDNSHDPQTQERVRARADFVVQSTTGPMTSNDLMTGYFALDIYKKASASNSSTSPQAAQRLKETVSQIAKERGITEEQALADLERHYPIFNGVSGNLENGSNNAQLTQFERANSQQSALHVATANQRLMEGRHLNALQTQTINDGSKQDNATMAAKLHQQAMQSVKQNTKIPAAVSTQNTEAARTARMHMVAQGYLSAQQAQVMESEILLQALIQSRMSPLRTDSTLQSVSPTSSGTQPTPKTPTKAPYDPLKIAAALAFYQLDPDRNVDKVDQLYPDVSSLSRSDLQKFDSVTALTMGQVALSVAQQSNSAGTLHAEESLQIKIEQARKNGLSAQEIEQVLLTAKKTVEERSASAQNAPNAYTQIQVVTPTPSIADRDAAFQASLTLKTQATQNGFNELRGNWLGQGDQAEQVRAQYIKTGAMSEAYSDSLKFIEQGSTLALLEDSARSVLSQKGVPSTPEKIAALVAYQQAVYVKTSAAPDWTIPPVGNPRVNDNILADLEIKRTQGKLKALGITLEDNDSEAVRVLGDLNRINDNTQLNEAQKNSERLNVVSHALINAVTVSEPVPSTVPVLDNQEVKSAAQTLLSVKVQSYLNESTQLKAHKSELGAQYSIQNEARIKALKSDPNYEQFKALLIKSVLFATPQDSPNTVKLFSEAMATLVQEGLISAEEVKTIEKEGSFKLTEKELKSLDQMSTATVLAASSTQVQSLPATASASAPQITQGLPATASHKPNEAPLGERELSQLKSKFQYSSINGKEFIVVDGKQIPFTVEALQQAGRQKHSNEEHLIRTEKTAATATAGALVSAVTKQEIANAARTSHSGSASEAQQTSERAQVELHSTVNTLNQTRSDLAQTQQQIKDLSLLTASILMGQKATAEQIAAARKQSLPPSITPQSISSGLQKGEIQEKLLKNRTGHRPSGQTLHPSNGASTQVAATPLDTSASPHQAQLDAVPRQLSSEELRSARTGYHQMFDQEMAKQPGFSAAQLALSSAQTPEEKAQCLSQLQEIKDRAIQNPTDKMALSYLLGASAEKLSTGLLLAKHSDKAFNAILFPTEVNPEKTEALKKMIVHVLYNQKELVPSTLSETDLKLIKDFYLEARKHGAITDKEEQKIYNEMITSGRPFNAVEEFAKIREGAPSKTATAGAFAPIQQIDIRTFDKETQSDTSSAPPTLGKIQFDKIRKPVDMPNLKDSAPAAL